MREFVPAAAQRTASRVRRSIREERVGKAESAALIYKEATCVSFTISFFTWTPYTAMPLVIYKPNLGFMSLYTPDLPVTIKHHAW